MPVSEPGEWQDAIAALATALDTEEFEEATALGLVNDAAKLVYQALTSQGLCIVPIAAAILEGREPVYKEGKDATTEGTSGTT